MEIKMQQKPINVNSPSVDYTVSSTSTAYQMPPFTGSIRVVNSTGGIVLIESGDSSVSISAPVAGVPYAASKLIDNTVEVFTVTNMTHTHIAIYAPSATGTLTIQYGDGI
jgi:hypothetical protein